MTVSGTLSATSGGWRILDTTRRVYGLSGVDFPPRLDGATVKVVGVVEDNFGGGVLHDDLVIRVQKWSVV